MSLKNIFNNVFCKAKEFFPVKMRKEIKELYITVAILNFAASAITIFEPIYFYTIGFPLYKIMLFYLAVYVAYFLFMPLGGKIAKQKGFEHGIIYGSFFQAIYLICLFGLPTNPTFIYGAILALAIQKSLFWPGYHADFAFFGQTGERGREIGNLEVINSLIYIIGPFFGGVIIGLFGFKTLFILMCFVVLISNIPMLVTNECFTPSVFKYGECYKRLFAKENRKYLLGYLGFGEELVVATVWPIFIYVIVKNYTSVGSLVSMAMLVTAVALLYIGRLTDTKDKHQVIKTGSLFYTFSWFMRLVTSGIFGVFLADFFSRVFKQIIVIPLFSGLYERAIKTSIVKTVIFFEMALTLGKILSASLLVLIFYFFGETWHVAFFLGGLFSLLFLVLSMDKKSFEKKL
jgi:MFS family permease